MQDWFDRMSLLPIFLMNLGLLLAAAASGFILGRSRSKTDADPERSHLVSVEGAVLGLLALLLGFSFAMAVSRYETRRTLVVDEANAIGTSLLRSRFLAEPYAAKAHAILLRYVDLRFEAARYADYGESRGLPAQTETLQQELWGVVTDAMRHDDKSLANALFAETVNQLIDTYGLRTDALRAHLPWGVLAVLHGLATAALCVVGYVEALGRRRHVGVPLMVALLITLVMTLIADLDRPREGLIKTSQKSMQDLKQSLQRK